MLVNLVPLVLSCLCFLWIFCLFFFFNEMTHWRLRNPLIQNWMFSRCCEMLRELDGMLCCCGTEALMSQYIKSDLIRCAALLASILVSRLWETVQPHDALYKKKQNKPVSLSASGKMLSDCVLMLWIQPPIGHGLVMCEYNSCPRISK